MQALRLRIVSPRRKTVFYKYEPRKDIAVPTNMFIREIPWRYMGRTRRPRAWSGQNTSPIQCVGIGQPMECKDRTTWLFHCIRLQWNSALLSRRQPHISNYRLQRMGQRKIKTFTEGTMATAENLGIASTTC